MSAAKHRSESQIERQKPASSARVGDAAAHEEVVVVQISVSKFWVKAVRVGIGAARTNLPKMVRESAKGRSYLITNSKNPNDESALLISPSELERTLESGRPRRTMGDVLRSMPFAALELDHIVVEPLLADGVPPVRLPD